MSTISFLVRVHNEERTLEASVRSLFSITMPKEIIIIIHNCDDRSLEIAERLQKEDGSIKIFHYEHTLSRAGVETLCTDSDSMHSIVRYCNWCLKKCVNIWKFKWDADFIMTPELAAFINSDLINHAQKRIYLTAQNSTSDNCEAYLSDSTVEYLKYFFWEIPSYSESTELRLPLHFIHDSELADLKPYWEKDPWYLHDNSTEAKIVANRISIITSKYGPEPSGMARASNPECDSYFLNIRQDTAFNFYGVKLMKAHVINMTHRSDRRNSVSSELLRMGFSWTIHDAPRVARDGYLGCALAHYLAVRDIYAEHGTNISSQLIVEDDALFTHDVETTHQTISKFYQQFGNDWDALFIGSFYQGYYNPDTDLFLRPTQMNQTTAYVINERFVHVWLNYLKNCIHQRMINPTDLNGIIDQGWSELLINRKIYCSNPKLVAQADNHSDIMNTHTLGGIYRGLST